VPISLILVNQVTLHHARRDDEKLDFCEIPGFWNFSQKQTSDFSRKSRNHSIYLGTIICWKISFLVQQFRKSVPSSHPFQLRHRPQRDVQMRFSLQRFSHCQPGVVDRTRCVASPRACHFRTETLHPISRGRQYLNPRFRQLSLPSNSSIPEKRIPPRLAISQPHH
jgi:hypothetical protein